MTATKQATIKDTDKSRNIQVDVRSDMTLDDMEEVLTNAGVDLGLAISHITTLGRKKYPGNRHWHLKDNTKSKGCLDVTYWPSGRLLWITIRDYEPDWVHKAGRELAVSLNNRLASG